MRCRHVLTMLASSLLAGLIGCSDMPTDPILSPTRSSHLSVASTPMDSLAQLVALSLADAAIRQMVRDNLRDSPFASHRIELLSYLRGSDGGRLAQRMAAARRSDVSDLIAFVGRQPSLELIVPRPVDRVEWTGSTEIAVIGMTAVPPLTRVDSTEVSINGFDLNGNLVSISRLAFSRRALLVVRWTQDPFPVDAEAMRKGAKQQNRVTVSTPAEERTRMPVTPREDRIPLPRFQIICDWRGENCYDDDPQPEPPQGGVDLDSWMTESACFGYDSSLTSANDADRDLVLDVCEYPIAYALRPMLNISVDDGASSREPYWSVSRHPTKPGVLQIFYALSYHDDGGTRYGGFGSHKGDSEWIVFEVSNPIGSRWRLDYATLSAHWGTFNDHTAKYAAEDLEYTIVYRARPRIWVSRSKHANYRSHSVCNSLEYCDGAYFGEDTETRPERNLGNYYAASPASGIRLIDLTSSAYPNLYYTEYYWTSPDFGGWNPNRGSGLAEGYFHGLAFFQI